MTVVEFPTYFSDRYMLVEGDGKGRPHGYSQRPAAERNARQSGFGLYDTREKTMLIPPDLEKRQENLEGKQSFLERQLEEITHTLQAIREARSG